MTRMVPSQVVLAIDRLFPNLNAGDTQGPNFTVGSAGALRCLLRLVEQIPHELLSASASDYAARALQTGRLEFQLQIWVSRGGSAEDHLAGENPVYVIRDVLERCPDEYPPTSIWELWFIGDSDLRASIRSDIGAAKRALQNGEWKAATVLAGAAIEALLHWTLSDPGTTPAQRSAAVATLPAQKRPPNNDMNYWNLGHYIDVAAQLTHIKPSTVTAANLAREYRNLIHPGKAKRLSFICDRASAFSAIAGLEHVIRDLKFVNFEVVKMRPSQALLNRIADWAAELLKESENSQAEMKWAEKRLREAGLFPLFLNPDLKNSQKWADEVIAQNLDMEDESIPWVKAHNSHPERAETFEELILSLIPTEGGL